MLNHSSDLVFCTIAAKNYLAHVRTWAESVRQHHPDSRIYLLLADEVDGYFDPDEEPFHVVTLDDLDISNLYELAFQYTLVEFNTAVKPSFINFLMDKVGTEKVIYFDPDVLILHPVTEIISLLDQHQVILTPHLIEPIDHPIPFGERTALLCGIYNLGFLAIRKGEISRRLLRWWESRLRTWCIDKLEEGYFVDQKWMDMVPGLFDSVYILRNPEFNVAFWNLHERQMGYHNKMYQVNNRPMIFYHFSSFCPEHPDIIIKYRKIDFGSHTRALFTHYSKRLYHHGYKKINTWPYAYSSFDNSILIHPDMRTVYRQHHEKAIWGSPFSVDHAASFYNWYRKRQRPRHRMVRYVHGTRFIQRRLASIKALLHALLGASYARFKTAIKSFGYIP